MRTIGFLGWQLPVAIVDTLACLVAVAAALAAHRLIYAVLRRIVRRSSASTDDILLSHACRPLRWILMAIALAMVRRHLHLAAGADAVWRQVAGFLVPAMLGWLAIAMVRAMQQIVEIKADITVADNLAARRRRTRSAILGRVAIFLVAFVTICLMLLSIPAVRAIGVTLMASAGLAGLVVGAAAQPALKNLIAGVQMAFSEPIRIDDVVIIEGEWGRIEEIRLTYVVVKIWDERRLIVPVSRFLEQPFQNWTRADARLLGSSFFYLDPTADIGRLRAKFEETVRADPRWDGRVMTLAVTDIREQVIEVRALISAGDSGRQFDLRTAIREELLAFIRDEMPEALPRRRAELLPGAAR